MKPGDMIMFPSDADSYALKKGLLLGFHDNPADVKQIEGAKKFGSWIPDYCDKGPRQVADILYKGKITTCWKHNIQPLEKQE